MGRTVFTISIHFMRASSLTDSCAIKQNQCHFRVRVASVSKNEPPANVPTYTSRPSDVVP